MIPRKKKICKECGQPSYLFSNKMCEPCYRRTRAYAEVSNKARNTVSKMPGRAVEPLKKKSGHIVPLRTKKRFEQEIEYKKICGQMDKVKVKTCFFCGKEIKGKADHHHLAGRSGLLLTNRKYIVHVHRDCHAAYHDRSVKDIVWFMDYVNRLSDIDVRLAEKEMIKYEKL